MPRPVAAVLVCCSNSRAIDHAQLCAFEFASYSNLCASGPVNDVPSHQLFQMAALQHCCGSIVRPLFMPALQPACFGKAAGRPRTTTDTM